MGVPLQKNNLNYSDLKNAFESELYAIADWWVDNTVDEIHGGFVGEMSVDNKVNATADKGIILNTRILWFFSEAALFTGNKRYTQMAERAYTYIVDHFLDTEHGGVFWALDYRGNVVNNRKQVYAQAFAIYGLSAYYKLTKQADVLAQAHAIFELIEANAQDENHQGYLEAFSNTWGRLDDMRLSEKDLNSPKSMNTHLHILEAYTALHIAAPNPKVSAAIKHCLGLFDRYIINKANWHLRMFQDMDWEDVSTSYSYGHDIECSWLMWEAVESLESEELHAHYKPAVIALAETCLEQGIGKHSEVLDAYNFETQALVDERVWWVQAEALVGFLNAYHLTGEQRYIDAALNVWEFINSYQKDSVGGEWHWLSRLDLPHTGDCKMGPWKAPYHNGRAMMESIKLVQKIFGNNE